ncbi:cobalt ECF transporter T component CbiQ [Actinotalea sp. Marseille-Q4924]|uniref:cobalt ECF transporter T component CbiQ n=1 Tax=Actinotalea sp. Marseille-Q4924 TaxID=2866571 RepID=UPI001CE45A8A|nr:cobalt ECF transporter T component CbiQ [Actinotalea sp. Marseille-Q4924]
MADRPGVHRHSVGLVEAVGPVASQGAVGLVDRVTEPPARLARSRPAPPGAGAPSPVHRLPAPAKLVAHVALVLVVVATPAAWFWAFGVYAVLLLAAVVAARLPARTVLRGMSVELPFVTFAVVLPFVALGPRTEVLGLSLSAAGLLAGWNVLAKATLGVVASVVLARTTTVPDLVAALRTLRVPGTLVAIVSFMVRYLGIVRQDLHRMQVAQEARGLPPQRRARLAAAVRVAGALFVRTYERGERVHLAMLARGGGSGLRIAAARPVATTHPAVAAVLPVLAATTLAVGWVLA